MNAVEITSEVESIIHDLCMIMYNYQKKNKVARECVGNTTTFIAVFKTIFPLIPIKAINCIVISNYHKGIPAREHIEKKNGSALITHMMVEITDGKKILKIDPSWETSRDYDADYYASWKVFCDNLKYQGVYEKHKEFIENDLLENYVDICKSAKKANSFVADGMNNQQLLYGADGEKICKDQLDLMIKSLSKNKNLIQKRKNKYNKRRR